jgi:deoxyribodipyrimidine photo-lyase
MHQLNQTGYMHNRLRMVVASFLTKDLGHRLAARRGLLRAAPQRLRPGRQQRRLAVGRLTGCDAQPYFRIFNPVTRARSSTPRAASSAATCRNWPLPDKLIHAPWLARPVDLAAAGVRLGEHYPLPLWTTRWRARRRWRAMRWALT